MSLVKPASIHLIWKVTARSISAAGCSSKQSHVLFATSFCALGTVHLPLGTKVPHEKNLSTMVLCRGHRLFTHNNVYLHTGRFHVVQKQEQEDELQKICKDEMRVVDDVLKEAISHEHKTMDKDEKLVPHKVLELLDENGELFGSVSRSDAIRLSKERCLKLVLVNPQSRPYPTYRLISVENFDKEQSRIKEHLTKNKKMIEKEVRISCGIGDHDLAVKRRQMNSWFEDPKHETRVKVVVKGGKSVTEKQQTALLHRLISGMEDRITFGNKPKLAGKYNPSLSVQLRKMSVKEKATYNKQKNAEHSLNDKGDMI